jgi:hypothetical protein
MTPLTLKTKKLIEKLYPPLLWEEVTRLLENECGQNLPGSKNSSPEQLEGLRFAALKVSEGNLAKLKEAVDLAKVDWRDLYVWSKFGGDFDTHQKWADKILAG